MKRLNYQIVLFCLLGLVVFSCQVEKMPLPVPNTESSAFGANDTNYVELQPIWDHAGFSNPLDITMGPDGVIFVADEGNDRIVALSRSGDLMQDNGLGEIEPIAHPRGISIDSKLNVLITNGSNTLYCWNQYLNRVTFDSVATEVLCYDTQVNDTVIYTFDELKDAYLSGGPVPTELALLFEKTDVASDTLKMIHPIYQSNNPNAQFNGVAAGPYGEDRIYLTESTSDNILWLILYPKLAIKTTGGELLFYYQAFFVRNIASYGSGAGTVDDPWAIMTDDQGDVYFSQLGGNFLVQKLKLPNFQSEYVLYQHDIMDLNRFKAPYDITLDDDNNIFVLDTEEKKVFKFGNSGSDAGQLLDLGKKGLALAEFEDARGLMVSNNVVYVLESGLNRIRRFQYSISDSDIPDDEQSP